MANRIKGITIEIGGDTTKLDKALAGTNKQLSTTQRELKDVERLLKLDPGNTELLAQKQRLLAQTVEATSKKLNTLRQAAKNADAALQRGKDYTAAYEPLKAELDSVNATIQGLEANVESMKEKLDSGNISTAQYDAFAKKLDDTRNHASELQQSIKSLNTEFSGSKINQSQYDALQRELVETEQAAKDAENAFDKFSAASQDADDAAGKMGDGFTVTKGIVADLAAGGIGFLAEKALEAVSAIWNLDEATEEYRESMGLLSTAFETAGFDTDTAMQAYRGFYEILGETDTATEAAQLLSSLAESEEDVSKWVEIAAGAYGTFGDSLPIESLMEAANETVKTGEVTGALADALNWAGISEEEVSKQLSMMADESDRAQYLMGLLSHTYSDAADSFYQNNEAIIESRNAQADLDESLAVLGQSVADLKSQFLETFGPYLSELAKFGADAINFIADAIDALGGALDWLGGKILGVIDWFRELLGIGQQATETGASGGNSRIASRSSPSGSDAPSGRALAVASEDVPHLASGGVARKNNPFLAVVGDNTQEDEVISPYSTIKRAAAQGVLESGLLTAQRTTQNTTMVLDGRTFARLIVPYIREDLIRTGVKLSK